MEPVQTIVGIAGASGAGKSFLAQELLHRMRLSRGEASVAILNEDSYYRSNDQLSVQQRASINYDHPEAFEHDLLVEHLASLRKGLSVDVPVYDYSEHNRSPETKLLRPAKILILEGILILHRPELRKLLDLKVFVDVPLDVCLSRRLERDTVSRGRTLESILAQYHETVRPMFFEFIDPSKNHADVIIPRGGQNTVAISVLESHLDRLF